MRHRAPARARLAGRIVVLACCCAAAAGQGAELSVEVTDARGRPAADAVILLHPAPGTAAPTGVARVVRTIDQRDETFVPYVETFRPGDAVLFSNSDATRHHVYSFSPLRRFEFVLAPGERTAPQALDAPGVIAVGCNIHDRMLAYLHVSDAPWQARTDAQGKARIATLAPGEYRLEVWHPQLAGAVPPPRAVVLDSTRARQLSSYSLTLRPDPRGAPDPERVDY
jgi:plastocyanin